MTGGLTGWDAVVAVAPELVAYPAQGRLEILNEALFLAGPYCKGALGNYAQACLAAHLATKDARYERDYVLCAMRFGTPEATA